MKDIDKIASKLAGNLSADQLRERWEQAQAKASFAPPEKTPEELAYWQKVWETPPATATTRRRVFAPEMGYEAGRDALKSVFIERAAEISKLTGQPFKWEFDEKEAEIIRGIIRYFLNADKPHPPHKGLFIYGAVGTGKTEIMRCFERWAESQKLEKAFRFTSMSAIYTQAKTNSDFDPLSQSVQFDRLFDEFGRYSGNVVNFGNPLDINEAIIEQRYERWQRYGQLTHFIANAEPNDLEAMFSPMIFDRLRQMCTSILFPGKSKRK